MNQNEVKISKYLSYVLRHRPDAIGLSLDSQGWVSLSELIDLSNRGGTRLTEALVRDVVARNDKQRFAISADGNKIRANQGHRSMSISDSHRKYHRRRFIMEPP